MNSCGIWSLCVLAIGLSGMSVAPAWGQCDLEAVRSEAERSLPEFKVQEVRVDAGTVTVLFARRSGTGTFAISMQARGTRLFSSVMDPDGAAEVARIQRVLSGWQGRDDMQRTLVQCSDTGSDAPMGYPQAGLFSAAEGALRAHRSAAGGPRLPFYVVVVLTALAVAYLCAKYLSVRIPLRWLLGRLATGLTLLLVSFFVSAVLVELAIRVLGIDDRLVSGALQFSAANTEIHRPSLDPFLHYELRPGASGHWDNCQGRSPYSITIDDFGARKPSHPFAKDRGVFRVLAFGGSTMHGACVNDDETIPAVMERTLNTGRRPAEGLRFEVWNFGTSGYTLAQAARQAREKLQILQPDLILVQLHNLSPRCFILGEDTVAPGLAPVGLWAVIRNEPGIANEQFAVPFVPPVVHEIAFDHSAFYRALVAGAKRRGYLGFECPACLELDAEEAEALSREAESRGIPVAYLVIPNDHDRTFWNRFLSRPSERLIDLYRPGRDPDFYEVHPRAPQLAEVAVALMEELRSRHLLPD